MFLSPGEAGFDSAGVCWSPVQEISVHIRRKNGRKKGALIAFIWRMGSWSWTLGEPAFK